MPTFTLLWMKRWPRWLRKGDCSASDSKTSQRFSALCALSFHNLA